MYAVIATGGKQYRVEPGQQVTVEKLDGQIGDAVELDCVMVVDDAGAVDLEATMAAVPALTAAGVSDFRGNVRLGATDEQALDELSRYVAAFRSATA